MPIAAVTERAAGRLAAVDGVSAVVLGGSRARGDADALSDVDLGLYYDPARPPAIAELRALARELDDRHPADAVTEIGGWGPWINGGGWLEIEGVRVDWLYRDLALVAATIDDCRAGRYSSHYQPGHPHAFHTHMYMAEVHCGRALFDRDGSFAALQARTAPYPPALRATIIARGWEAGFALETAAKAARRGDTFQVAGSLFRCAACLVQTLFALNGRYFLNEKRAVVAAASFPLCPDGFAQTVSDVLGSIGSSPDALASSLARMEELVRSVDELCRGQAPEPGAHSSSSTS
jgi:predicted nucleotidyltransferase